ncbi:MAG: hypothetical protein KL787_07145 [Taibaiella sp.]|nr:hypothetical protein [Taibaiella sp.]
MEVRTNEFGSYQASFILPEGLMNGVFTISDEQTNLPVSVEEYKRPLFFVEFDKMKDGYALDQQVRVKGKAESYSGVGLDHAKVKYRVVRSGYLPYPWLYYKSIWNIETKVIAIGETVTLQDGTFEIPFELLPDPAAKKEDGGRFQL